MKHPKKECNYKPIKYVFVGKKFRLGNHKNITQYKTVNNQNLRDSYIALNRSFSRTLVHHIGIDSGFFTEYSYLVHAILYCLAHHLQLKLYSDDANFGVERGWTDYFQPFCEEVHESFHVRYNYHAGITWKRALFDTPTQERWKILKWKTKLFVFNKYGRYLAYRTYGKSTKLSYSIGTKPCHPYCIPELGIDGDYIHAFRTIASIIWRLNPDMRQRVDAYKKCVALPKNEPYMGCQIRGGDKITECSLISPSAYGHRFEQLEAKHVFVLTDDYTLFEQLQTDFPRIHWYTLCQPSEHGYVNNLFNQQEGHHKKEQMARFFASMELLMQSSHFIGSITPAPSHFLIKMKLPHAEAIDCPQELVAHAVALRIDQRAAIAEKN